MSQLAKVLEEREEDVLRAWTAQVRQHLAPGGETHAELADHIPLFLRQLRAVLRGETSRDHVSPEAGTSTVGREHGAQRFRLGFALGALVREYGLLRDVLWDLIAEQGLRVSLEEVRLLTNFVATAIAEAVEEHARQQERELRTFKSLVEASDNYIALVDLEGQVTYLNPAGQRLLGFSSLEQARATSMLAFVSEDSQERVVRDVVPRLLQGHTWQGEVRHRHLGTGEAIPLAAHTFPVKDEHGQVELLGSIGRDLRERKRQETEHERLLRETERLRHQAEGERARLNALFQQAPVAIGILRGPEIIIEVANPLLCRLWGRAPEQVLGRPAMDALPELRGMGLDDEVRRVMATGVPFVATELPVQFKRGPVGALEPGHFSFVYDALRDEAGHIEGVILIAVDVGEAVLARQKVEALLRRSQEAEQARAAVMDALAEQSLIAMSYLHGPDYVAQTENALNRRLAGRDSLGQPFRQAFPELHQQGFTAMLDRVRETGEPLVSHETLMRMESTPEKPAHEMILDFVYQPVRAPGSGVAGILTLGLEVTKQVHARRDAQRMAEEERRLRDFEQHLIGIVSHDLRNPLSAISLGLQLLLRRESLDARTLQSLLRLQSSTERAVRMVRDLLDFTQARLGGGLKMERAPMDMHPAVLGVVEELRMTHPERELRLEQHGDGHGAWDGDRVAQLLGNLVSNALKYSPADSPVTVRGVGDPEALWLEVHNGGAPIAPEALPRLFQPLQRAVAGNDKATRSVGLGLYIVEQIARAHGGGVQVTSSASEGTRFTVRLPRSG